MTVSTSADLKDTLIQKFKTRQAKIGIVGLGYVGLPLAVCKAKVGFEVIGIDRLEDRVQMINSGENYISDVDDKELKDLVLNKKKISATSSFEIIPELDAIIICVPTPLTKNREPNITYIKNVTEETVKYLRKGQLVSLESTTYPGTTEEVMLPILEKNGLKVGEDFFLTFSPERVDPGNARYTTQNTNKVLGGVTPACTEVGTALYQQSIVNIVPVSSPSAAEMVKVFENTFRAVNIALVNELALLCDKMDLNVWEVLDAAGTKPFGIMSFYPGPGVGGHCIPIDPFYLTWKAREYDFHTRFIELAGEINVLMPIFVKEKVYRALNNVNKSLKNSNVLILGVAYKKDIDDSRESPAEKVIELLAKDGVNVLYNDPYIPEYRVDGKIYKSTELTQELWNKVDCTIIISEHSCYDYEDIVKNTNILLDTRNATKHVKQNRDKIILL
ncbi:MAG: nucleotide sugar dehydrogenase [Cyanobacteriota bacterium]